MRSFILVPLFAAVVAGCSSSSDDVATTADTGTLTSDATSGATTDTTIDTAPLDTGTTSDSASSETSGDTSTSDTTSDAPADVVADSAASCDAAAPTCAADEYCDAPKCGTGVCKKKPATPSAAFAPACGCASGVTYWNAEQAAAAGEGATAGACPLSGSTTRFCGIKPCSDGDTCVTDLTDKGMCTIGSGVGKACWHIPTGATCPASETKDHRACDGATGTTCKGYCEAILDDTPFLSDSTCP